MIARAGRRVLGLSRPRTLDLKIFQGTRWSSSSPRQWSTPLAKRIAEAIAVSSNLNMRSSYSFMQQTTGPISIAAYMRQCLTSPDGGYYTANREGRDQFGQKGDFVTSPEISQIFGELFGLWLLTEWMMQGRKKQGVEIIEVGPGRGTLMDDILRAWHLASLQSTCAAS